MSETIYDITVVGSGHAGVEATYIASQFKELKVALISIAEVEMASAPCNPAIGGVGKGQVVREIDALGGLMGELADRAGIQYRTLNESKGFAVQSTRVQIDKITYSKEATKVISGISNVSIIKDKVVNIKKKNEIFEVETADKKKFFSKKIIITTGTFLNGLMHTGTEKKQGGRVGCDYSPGLMELFKEVKLNPQRFKTGTPPRLNKDTINYKVMHEQESDPKTRNFHYRNFDSARIQTQTSCFLTHTNENTLGIIRENKEKSPIFNGQIQGVGPRYCPSIEDKAYRYLDRNRHHVFVEPESFSLNTVYPNGISTSLPKEIQLDFLRTIEGFENVEILVPGYAVEYDVVDTTSLNITLESKDIAGLYFAGQVNGTSGYEEAAGQGLIAGVNAALAVLNRDPLVLNRHESYIGVMVEDLISNKRDEPYRLFTSRSEDRLFLREDNTYTRMANYRKSLELNGEIDTFLTNHLLELNILREVCQKHPHILLSIKQAENPVLVLKEKCEKSGLIFSDIIIENVAIDIKYDGYIKKSEQLNSKVLNLENKQINWEKIVASKNVSFECKLRIKGIRPATFGQLKRIEGIRPATLAVVAGGML
ncbi:MAG: tRNA uridine-5-carboxymethylaminomethyl(34) synthesis enzyme MnmG [Bacteriovoracaceae bacterium]